MNDQERMAHFLEKVKSVNGLSENLFRRLNQELERAEPKFGYDEQGRLRIALFDAQSYDRDSFDRCNQGRFSIHYISAALNTNTAAAGEGCKVICVFVNDNCNSKVVERLASKGVELIALRCAGFNNVDLGACAAHNISVVRVPAYSPHAVAEHAVGLILMLNRKLHRAYARNQTGYFVLDGLTGFDLYKKTAGIIGTGKIGQCLIDILLGFGCRILAFDKFPNQQLAEREGVEYVELDRLFKESDMISLHVPLFPETHYMINESTIDQMKDGVMLINTSRGGLVDTRAPIAGLKSGKIGSAGLDVYEEEAGIFFRNISDKVLTDDVLARLMTFHNVVVTSHQAFLTHEALNNIAQTTLSNIEEFAQNKRGTQLTNAVEQQ
ncbi:MAG: 2-hydroxyacid dehydrogenase [Gemmataceae bacterium]